MMRRIFVMVAAATLLAIGSTPARAQVSCCQGPNSCFNLGSEEDYLPNRDHCTQNGGTLTTGSCDGNTGLCGGTPVCCNTTCNDPQPSCLQTTAEDCEQQPMGSPVRGDVCGSDGRCGSACPAPPPPTKAPDGASCSANGDCASDSCVFTFNGLSGPCSSSLPSQFCTCGSTPTEGNPPGASCTANSDCASGTCELHASIGPGTFPSDPTTCAFCNGGGASLACACTCGSSGT